MERERKNIATNRQARHEYFILETLEAGIVLTGTEVKSLRQGKGSLKESYAQVQNGEVYLYNCHISTYDFGNRFNHDPLRPRKLLLHKEEIRRLIGKTKEKGLTLVPWPSILTPTIASRWSWLWPKGRNSTTNGKTWPNATPSAPSSGPCEVRSNIHHILPALIGHNPYYTKLPGITSKTPLPKGVKICYNILHTPGGDRFRRGV